MSRVYVCVYHCTPGRDLPFDYDRGDDPSFLSSAGLRDDGGVLTWGVCRPDVRNAIQPNDLVGFFAAERQLHFPQVPVRYYFTGFATVDRKIRQSDIWQQEEFAVYRQYPNLLIRKARGGFEHFEPKAEHPDWLWRIVDRRRNWRENIQQAQRDGYFRRGSVVLGENYVLFKPEGDGTLVLAHPRVVAEAFKAGCPERWRDDPVAADIRNVILSRAPRPNLRTRNKQRPHRHIVIEDGTTAEWLVELKALCRRCGLKARRIGAAPAPMETRGLAEVKGSARGC